MNFINSWLKNVFYFNLYLFAYCQIIFQILKIAVLKASKFFQL